LAVWRLIARALLGAPHGTGRTHTHTHTHAHTRNSRLRLSWLSQYRSCLPLVINVGCCCVLTADLNGRMSAIETGLRQSTRQFPTLAQSELTALCPLLFVLHYGLNREWFHQPPTTFCTSNLTFKVRAPSATTVYFQSNNKSKMYIDSFKKINAINFHKMKNGVGLLHSKSQCVPWTVNRSSFRT